MEQARRRPAGSRRLAGGLVLVTSMMVPRIARRVIVSSEIAPRRVVQAEGVPLLRRGALLHYEAVHVKDT